MSSRRPVRLPRVAVIARSVSSLHRPGGLERHVHDLVRHLLRRELAVTLITRPPADDRERAAGGPPLRESAQLAIHYVPYLTFPLAGRRGTTVLDRSTAYPLFGWRAGRLATRLAARGEIDLVHGLGASALGYALSKRRPVPFVFNPQGLEEFGATDPARAGLGKRIGYLPLQAAVRACARRADRVIATDRALVPTVERHLGLLRDRLRLVPNAVDIEHCDALADASDRGRVRTEYGLHPAAFVLLSVGRLEGNKGFPILARALAGVEDGVGHGVDWHWVVAGEGPARTRLIQEIERAGVGARCMLLGRLDDRTLHAWYAAADVFVHPTLYEGSSLVTLEAMVHRLPVIATTAGGLPDKVVPDRTGWLVPPGDEHGLASAIREAMRNREALQAMGEEGRALAEREFSWPAVTDRLLDVYEELGVRARRSR